MGTHWWIVENKRAFRNASPLIMPVELRLSYSLRGKEKGRLFTADQINFFLGGEWAHYLRHLNGDNVYFAGQAIVLWMDGACPTCKWLRQKVSWVIVCARKNATKQAFYIRRLSLYVCTANFINFLCIHWYQPISNCSSWSLVPGSKTWSGSLREGDVLLDVDVNL